MRSISFMDANAFIKKIDTAIGKEPFMQDFHTFLAYVTENKVKLTPKGKWIPMKHLYAISALLKEPLSLDIKIGEKMYKTREEWRAPRIYFIDLLACAGECIKSNSRDVLIKTRDYARFMNMDNFNKKRWLVLAWYYHIVWDSWFPQGDFGRLLQAKALEIIPHLKEWKETRYMINFDRAVSKLITDLDLRWDASSQTYAKNHMRWGIAQCLLNPLIYFNIIDISYEKQDKNNYKAIKGFHIRPLGKIFLDELVKAGEMLKSAKTRQVEQQRAHVRTTPNTDAVMTTKDIEKTPSYEAWKPLYEAAMEVKNLAPWGWMRDSDLFGVQNPRDNEIGYCCVVGAGGQVFGLVVYLGTEGLEGYLGLSEGTVAGDSDDALHGQKCLSLTFDDRKDLQDPDHDVIRNLGLKFSGRNAWPLFRSFRPGYLPWYLTADEAEFLTLCLRQAVEVAARFKENPKLFSSPDGETHFVRTQDAGNGWKDAWLKPPPPLRKMVMMVKTIDEERFENIRNKCARAKQTWEIDYFYAPMHIAEKDKRPYFPVALLFADRHSYFILRAHVSDHDNFRTEFFEELFKTFEQHKTIPEEIAVRKDEFLIYLKPFSERLGIKVSLTKKLRSVDSARKGMFEHFRKDKYAEEARSEKVGRNEPCPCGSGRKYKKCCGF